MTGLPMVSGCQSPMHDGAHEFSASDGAGHVCLQDLYVLATLFEDAGSGGGTV